MPIRYVLFDHDGTLMSTLGVRSRALELAVAELTGRQINGEAIFAETHGQSLAGLSQMLTEGSDVTPEAMVDAYRAHYYVQNQAGIDPYEGIEETLNGLRSRGIAMAVVTSKLHRGAKEELEGAGLAGFFGRIVGADDVTEHKPNAEPLLQAMNAISAVPAQTLMVGDTMADLGGARAAGTKSGAALWDSQDEAELRAAQPDYLLTDPREILRLLDD